jgi:hypothetical protein
VSISFNDLGRAGRFGNQLFQYAALRSIAKHRGLHWMIPGPDAVRPDNYGLFECFELKGCKPENIGEQQRQQISWREFHFNQELFDKCPDDIDLDGYFQTDRYMVEANIEDEIRQDYTFKDEWKEPCVEFFNELENDNLIFLHIRRGNPNVQGVRGEKWSYQLLQHTHPLMKEEYYREALAQFPDDCQVMVVSDVIEWAKRQPYLQGDRFLFSDNSKMQFNDGAAVPYVDLCLMSMCKGAIIANSSLSWWGAWLQGGTGKVIAPKPWFGPAVSHYVMDDLIPKQWVELYNDPSEVPPEYE